MNHLDILLNNIEEAIIITDEEGKIIFFNKVAFDISEAIGWEKLQMGEELVNSVKPERKQIMEDMLSNVRAKKESFRTFVEYFASKGSTLYFELNFVPVVKDDGRVGAINLLIRDITPQKIFEKKITNIVTDLTNLIEHANAVIIGIDSRGYITEWNEHCVQITGFDKNDVYTQKIAEFIIAEKDRAVFEKLMALALSKEFIGNHEVSIRTKDGRELILLISATPRVTSAGLVNGITFVGQDITELTDYRKSLEKKVAERTRDLKRALEKEKEATEMKGRFVSIASHEFRTPLASISFAAGFIKNYHHKITKEQLHAKTDSIEKNVQHMTALLDDVLTIGKNESPKFTVLISTLNFQDFLQKIAEEIKISNKNSHEILMDFDLSSPVIESDEKLLRNIFINLLTNAIKYSPGSTHIQVNVSEHEDMIAIVIRDYGIGIKPEEIERIFDPFHRASNATHISGTGLGLSIVKRSVEILGGQIEVESNIGKGSAFKVKLPKK